MARPPDPPAAVDGYDLVLRAPRALVGGREVAACVAVRGGRIAAVAPPDPVPAADRTVRLGTDVVLLPGLVDTHVHVNEPGRTHWEGFDSATRAAAAGGVTTIVDMPLNSQPPTVDVPALAAKRRAAEGRVHVDVGFWAGAVPGNAAELPALLAAGAFGAKCFLLPSGVDEFPPLDSAGLITALRALATVDGLLLVHAEDAATIAAAAPAGGRRYRDFLASRPPAAETVAIRRLVDAAAETGARVHVVHVSGADSLDAIAAARAAGIRVTAETCPHYLVLTAEEVPDGATEFKCCPPVRPAANRDRLWRGLAAGVLDAVVSDHSPCPAALKAGGDFGAAWGGIASLQLGLPLVWTEARRRGHQLADVLGWMAEGPARLAGLAGKGTIAVGFDADFCVFAPDQEQKVDPSALLHRHPVTPYGGRRLTGRVRQTWLGGLEVTGDVPRGCLVVPGISTRTA